MHIIFDYEKEMKFRPLTGQGEPTALLSHNPDFDDFLVEWDEMRKNTIIEKLQTKNLKIGSYLFLRNQDF